MDKPAVGTQMFFVKEHFYYVSGRAGPLLEYCVCEATVTGFYTGGYTEVVLSGKNPDGYRTPYYYKLSEIEKTIFYTSDKAAILAQKMTEQHEPVRNCGVPMRKPWIHLLPAEDTKN